MNRLIPERIRQRLTTQAIAAVAAGRNTDRLTIENAYSRARVALVHVTAGETFHVDTVRDVTRKLDDLLVAHEKFVGMALGELPDDYLTRLNRLAAKLRPAHEADRKDDDSIVTCDDITVLLAVVDETVRQHVTAGYDPKGIIDVSVLLLASMVAENFDAYQTAINP